MKATKKVMNNAEYILAMFGDENEATQAGLDLATIATSVLASIAMYMTPDAADAVAVDTRLNAFIAGEIAASLLVRNGGDYGRAAIDIPLAVERAIVRIENDSVTAEPTMAYQGHLRELLRNI